MTESVDAVPEGAAETTNDVTTSGPEPILVKVHGKEFNVADPIQKAQLATWDEAHAKLQGRQTNELGELRKFYESRKPEASETELLAKAKQKAAEGNFEEALDQVFSSLKGQLSEVKAQGESERKNDELWTEYLSERPELAKSVGLKRVKTIGATLDIYNPEKDAFAVLDEFFNPLREKPSQAKPASDEKPPRTVSGGVRTAPKAASDASDSKSMQSFEDLIDSRSVNQRRKA